MLVRTDKELLKNMTEKQLVDRVIANVTREIERLHKMWDNGLTKIKIEYNKDFKFDIKLDTTEQTTLTLVKQMEYFSLEDIKRLQNALKNIMFKKYNVPVIIKSIEI